VQIFVNGPKHNVLRMLLQTIEILVRVV